MTRPFRIAPFRVGTALDRYDRLEAVGIWRESPAAAPREVVVAFGTSTLVLRDGADGTLGHWALAGLRAVGREGGRESGATVYAMTADGYETLAIGDREMVAAIDAVSAAASGFPAPQPTGPRRWPFLLAGLAAVAAAAYAAPALLAAQAVSMVSPEVAERLGGDMLLRLLDAHGPLCTDPAGTAALGRLAEAAAGAPATRVQLLDLPAPVAALPGDLLLLDRDLLLAGSPEEVAGWLLLARTTAAETPPLAALMASAGPLADLRYILTGALPEPVLARAAADAVAPAPADPAAMPALARALAEAGVPPGPLVGGLRRTGDAAVADALLAAAPAAEAEAEPLLPPPDWAALRRACA